MKYGMRERLSGMVILIALALIFVPMLFDEPVRREERPEPVLTIEKPVEVERQDVPDPEPPQSLGQIQFPSAPPGDDSPGEEEDATRPGENDTAGEQPEATASQPAEDPIAELARAADRRMAQQAEQERQAEQASSADDATPPSAVPEGEWAVQAGSFAEPANVERLEAQLREQGFPVYRRPRDNDLTSVYVGPYASSETGERVMSELKERANIQGLLVRVRE